MLTRTFFARAPLAPGRFAPLPAGAVSASGVMRDRLIALRAGLLSRCASLYPETGEDSAFFGGSLPAVSACADLLEAKLLTGAALGDDELCREALALCARVIENQREDGSFGGDDASFAARGRMLRALEAAYTLSGDKAVLTFMLRYMKYLKDTLETSPLGPQDAMHTADTLEAGVFLYNVTGQKAILSVLMTLIAQGADYTSIFHAFPYRTPVSRSFSEDAFRAALDREDETGYAHHLLRTANAANLCQGLRASSLCGVLTGSGKHLSAAETGLARMNKSHGAACGGVSGDPLLAGTHPSRGVTALSLCELASSLETMLACPNGEHGSDQLDALMYNGVAAAFGADGRSVQSIQQANQVLISRVPRFPLAGDGANVFSLEDRDTLAALLAAWPRFVRSQWLLSRDDGLFANSYAPCQVRYRLGGASVRIAVESRYPENGSVRMTLSLSQSAAFPLHLRIPAWAKGATAAIAGEILSGEAGSILTINREWHNGDEILLTLPMTPEFVRGFHDAASVARGPLRFVYAPKSTAETHEDGTKTLRAQEGFGVALMENAPLEVVNNQSGVRINTRALPAKSWGLKNSSCDQPPIAFPADTHGALHVTLVPYAEAAVRLCVMPLA
ncbi:MAG: glycoside hydrolase family 127 protein [Eubacteriales bacterium]|nr:glycoside hydrolase family 127 protein [Eubacteriales bacterium]